MIEAFCAGIVFAVVAVVPFIAAAYAFRQGKHQLESAVE